MKNLLKIIATLVVGLLVFTACEDDSTLNVPASTFIDLGEEFNPLDGVTVDDGDLEDVDYTWTDSLDNTIVGEYVITYELNGTTMSRSVFVQVDELVKEYFITDQREGQTAVNYTIDVEKGDEYNELLFLELVHDEIEIEGTVDGNTITIAPQEFTVDGAEITLEGDGEYDGEAGNITKITFTESFDDEDDITIICDFTPNK